MPIDYGLAESVRAGRGAYALLLGSGVSISSGMPSAWGVKKHLIQKMMTLEGIPLVKTDPFVWYLEHFNEEAEYGSLLQRLGRNGADRANLLKDYFEPTEEDRIAGKKQPTTAHQSIAQLVSRGFVRVILTTNFDRLMEQALQSIGIEPTVVADVEAASRPFRLNHDVCTIVKINGDYLDPTIRNTADELTKYAPSTEALLSRILTEYGLICCGWSGEYDDRIRSLVTESGTGPYSTYFAHRGKVAQNASDMLDQRNAVALEIDNADKFFEELVDGVEALAHMPGPEAWSRSLIEEQARRFVPDPVFRIRLADLVRQETDRVIEFGRGNRWEDMPAIEDEVEKIRQTRTWFENIERNVSGLAAILTIGGLYGGSHHANLWKTTFRRLARTPLDRRRDGAIVPDLYAALIALYSFGAASVAASDYSQLFDVVNGVRLQSDRYYEPLKIYEHINFHVAMVPQVPDTDNGVLKNVTSQRYMLGARERIFSTLFNQLGAPDLATEALGRFEFLYGLEIIHQRRLVQRQPWTPATMIGIDNNSYGRMLDLTPREAGPLGDLWPPLVAGFFEGNPAVFNELVELYPRSIANLNWQR